MCTESEALEIFRDVGAIITSDHIVYTSGNHGDTYVNKDAVYVYPMKISMLCLSIAKQFQSYGVEVVIAPAVGAVIISQWVAYHLSVITGRRVLGVYADKNDGTFTIKRGYEKLIPGMNVLVVEDILTTGGSAKSVVEVTRAIGGNVVGVGVLCNRGGITTEDLGNVPHLYATANLKLQQWKEDDCPLCAQNIPVNTVLGKGTEFLARKS